MTLPLLAAALVAAGPNFSETINETNDKFTLNYVSKEDGNVNSPLGLWFTFNSQPSNLSGELSHKSVSYSLFDNYNPTESPVFVGPIDAFLGEKISGNWQLKLFSDNPFELNSWGITTTIPEPSTFPLLLLGSVLLYLKRKP